MTVPATLHGTAVAIGGRAVLFTGAPGSGKSDLALRLIDRGAVLVADDRVLATAQGGAAWLAAPPALAGLIEMRGIGIITRAAADRVPLVLVCPLDVPADRLPQPRFASVAGLLVPSLAVAPFAASAALVVETAMALLAQGRLWDADADAGR
jgi:hypothetical protein